MYRLFFKSPQNMCLDVFDVWTFFLSPHRTFNKCEIAHKATNVSRVYLLLLMTIFTPRGERGYRNNTFKTHPEGGGGKTVQWVLPKTEHRRAGKTLITISGSIPLLVDY